MTRIYWDGPSLKRVAEHRLEARKHNGRPFYGAVKYRYIGDDGKRAPAYWARRIELTAFHVSMGEPLDGLAEVLAGIPGCAKVIRHDGDSLKRSGSSPLRPQVRALFDRETQDPDLS
jgi:hypothetical protein